MLKLRHIVSSATAIPSCLCSCAGCQVAEISGKNLKFGFEKKIIAEKLDAMQRQISEVRMSFFKI
jgi:hypothetical protein